MGGEWGEVSIIYSDVGGEWGEVSIVYSSVGGEWGEVSIVDRSVGGEWGEVSIVCNSKTYKACGKDRIILKCISVEQCGYFGLDSSDSGQSSESLSRQQRNLCDDTQISALLDATESVWRGTKILL
jgi:hypothetical protein